MFLSVKLEPGWQSVLNDFIKTSPFQALTNFISDEYQTKAVFPQPQDIFKAFWLTPLANVKVVILGQDPYHGAQQAHGLCFSVPAGVALPPSLKNIYKEIESDLKIKKDFKNGNLEDWARQGVFLLNAILTVKASLPASHRGRGWEEFTDMVIKKISEQDNSVVFILWGNYARSKKGLIDGNKHLILEAPHPSPLSAYQGFFGCRHFSRCNKYLKDNDQMEIDW